MSIDVLLKAGKHVFQTDSSQQQHSKKTFYLWQEMKQPIFSKDYMKANSAAILV